MELKVHPVESDTPEVEVFPVRSESKASRANPEKEEATPWAPKATLEYPAETDDQAHRATSARTAPKATKAFPDTL